jgi:uncharacterized protein
MLNWMLSCILVSLSGSLADAQAAAAQNKVDPEAKPLYDSLDLLQASPKWRVFAAVVTRDHAKLQALLKGGDSPNLFSMRHRLPLVMASQIGDLEAVKMLVQGGAEIDLFDSLNENALTMATERERTEIVQFLLDHHAQVNLNSPLSGESALFRALHIHNQKLLELLVHGGGDINRPNVAGNTPLMLASIRDDLDTVDFLKGLGARFNSPAEEFFCAASHGDVETLNRILDSMDSTGNGPKAEDRHAGAAGLIDGNKQKQASSVVNRAYEGGVTPLMAAAGTGQTPAVKAILAAGAHINALDAANDTALMYAIKSRHKSTILALLDAGADPKIVNMGGVTTLLQMGTYFDDADLVHFLIGHGVPANGGSSIHETPLMAAATFGHIETVKILLKAHVPINAQSTEGLTALSSAAISGEIEVLKLLLKAGADPLLRDGEGKTALERATTQGRPEVVELLKQAQDAASGSSANPVARRSASPVQRSTSSVQ